MAQQNSAENPPTKVPAVTRAVAILRQLGASTEPQGVNQLARKLTLVPSTCMHILKVLVGEGLVDFDPTSKRYTIGMGILPIAHSAIKRNNFVTLTHPKLVQLSETFSVTAMATQLFEANEMVVVGLSHAPLPFRLSSDIGSRFPAFTSATGRCVAAFGDFDTTTLQSRFALVPWDKQPSFDTWKAQIDNTRRDGYGIDLGEFISGVTIIAAPFFNSSGAVTRSLVALGTSEKMEMTGITSIAHKMLKMRDSVSDYLMSN